LGGDVDVTKKERAGLSHKLVEVLGEIIIFPFETPEDEELFEWINWNIAPDFFTKCKQVIYPLKKTRQDYFINLFGELGPYDIVLAEAGHLIKSKQWNHQLEGELRLIEFLSEPPRDCRRPQSLRGWGHGTRQEISQRGEGAGGSAGG
jgi:hypothetical protein